MGLSFGGRPVTHRCYSRRNTLHWENLSPKKSVADFFVIFVVIEVWWGKPNWINYFETWLWTIMVALYVRENLIYFPVFYFRQLIQCKKYLLLAPLWLQISTKDADCITEYWLVWITDGLVDLMVGGISEAPSSVVHARRISDLIKCQKLAISEAKVGTTILQEAIRVNLGFYPSIPEAVPVARVNGYYRNLWRILLQRRVLFKESI